MGSGEGLIGKLKTHKKPAIIAAALLAAAIVAFVVLSLTGTFDQESDRQAVEVKVAADLVHMERRITAAGKVTTGEKNTISLAKGKTLKAVCVSVSEGVPEGHALVYYTDGTHTDAPYDGIVASVHAPKCGNVVTDSHSIGFNDTRELYLKVTVPEDEINNVNKGDTAQIVINAKPHQSFYGEIIDKKDVSTTLINEIRSDQSDAKDEDEEDADDEDADDEDADSEEEDAGDESDDESGDEDSGKDLDEEETPDEDAGDGSVVYYSVNIRFENDGTIKPGMSASCIITVSNRNDVLAVPIEAVNFDSKGKAFVYKENGKEREKTYIRTGGSDASNVEVESGLERGDVIIYDKY